MGDDGQARPALRHVEVTARRAGAAAVRRDGPVHRAEAFLLVAVQVVGMRVTGLNAGLDHGVVQRVVVVLRRGHADRAVAAVIFVGADVAAFRLPEIGQAVAVGPVVKAGLARPVVVIQRVAADIAHAVDQRGAAKPLAAPAFHAAVVHVRLGIGQEGPVVAPALQREGQGGRHLGAEVEAVVRAAGFQQQDADAFVFGQPGGQDVAGRTGTDDDVVELLDGRHEFNFLLEHRRRPKDWKTGRSKHRLE